MGVKNDEEFQKKSQINKLKNLAFGKKPANQEFLLSWHHAFMINYGWIPLEDFKQMPVPTFINLGEELARMADEINKKGRG